MGRRLRIPSVEALSTLFLPELDAGLSKFSAVVVCHNVEVPSAQKLTTIPVKKFTGTFDVRFVHNMHILY